MFAQLTQMFVVCGLPSEMDNDYVIAAAAV